VTEPEQTDVEEMQAHYAMAIDMIAKLQDALETIRAMSNCPPEIELICIEALKDEDHLT
jgi:hypothetical protein